MLDGRLPGQVLYPKLPVLQLALHLSESSLSHNKIYVIPVQMKSLGWKAVLTLSA